MVGEDRHADLPLDRVVADELELRGTHGIPAHRYSALLEMVRGQSLAPEMLVQHTLALENAGEALTQLGTARKPGIQVVDSIP
jgi:alcohol dehydrogenase